MPSPLPADGQASALLEDRKAEQQAKVEQFKYKLGKVERQETEKPSEDDFEQNRQRQIKALLGAKKN